LEWKEMNEWQELKDRAAAAAAATHSVVDAIKACSSPLQR
jgi:hypothetical protein